MPTHRVGAAKALVLDHKPYPPPGDTPAYMWPWGHLAVAYLTYSGLCRARESTPTAVATVAIALGSQLPDLVDKPLAWTFGVLPTGRSLMHSAITVAVLSVVVVWVARHRDRPEPYYALALGTWTHILVDALPGLEKLSYLAWPLLAQPTYTLEPSFLAHVQAIALTPWFLVQAGLTVIATVVWYRDGTPGLNTDRLPRR
ncbi:MAG: metal-dependent hydrolase [Halodesulfurarchaeum sp.]